MRPLDRLVVAWGLAGPALVLARALWRLLPAAVSALGDAVADPRRALLLAGGCAAMAYLEGYRGFQHRLVPRVRALAHALPAGARWRRIAAPLVVLELVGAPPSRLARRWALVALIAAVVHGTRALPPDVRGIVAAAVCTGLGWGALALLHAAIEALGATPSRNRDRTEAPCTVAPLRQGAADR
ncbi:MAG: hypothetical protein MUE41_06285 [Gemmatimonadaceae bacterium]|jgi:hypothetical protein|nr:hypothetical protein [Gemmatimonadaceae bacterium]